jgi:L-alanine-DL-glutamate epimerase-like enolase superfamily enzyme
MKITQVEALHLRLRLPRVEEVADGTQDCLLVRLHTDAGLTGLGEVVSCSYVARAVVESPRSAPYRHGLAAIIEGIVQALLQGTQWYGPGGVARHAMSGGQGPFSVEKHRLEWMFQPAFASRLIPSSTWSACRSIGR